MENSKTHIALGHITRTLQDASSHAHLCVWKIAAEDCRSSSLTLQPLLPPEISPLSSLPPSFCSEMRVPSMHSATITDSRGQRMVHTMIWTEHILWSEAQSGYLDAQCDQLSIHSCHFVTGRGEESEEIRAGDGWKAGSLSTRHRAESVMFQQRKSSSLYWMIPLCAESEMFQQRRSWSFKS